MLSAAAILVYSRAAGLPIQSFVTTKVLVLLVSPVSALPRMLRSHKDIIQHIFHLVHAELQLFTLLLVHSLSCNTSDRVRSMWAYQGLSVGQPAMQQTRRPR